MGRKKKQEEGSIPAWIVTYGDLMSLLLTFFVLLVSFSTISEEEFNQAMMSVQGALGVMPRLDGVISFQAPHNRKQAGEEFQRAARQLRRRLQIEGMEKQVKIEFDAYGGLKVTLPSEVLFDSGSATLRADAYGVLKDVGEVLNALPDAFIEVRGHTDSSAIGGGGRFRDNYDLSYFRARAVAERLTTLGGVPMQQFELIALGDSQPLATNDTVEGRAANRRVEIHVRGLVNRSKMNAMTQGFESLRGQRPAETPPASPRELDDRR